MWLTKILSRFRKEAFLFHNLSFSRRWRYYSPCGIVICFSLGVFSSARLERQTVNLDVGGSNPSRPVTLLGNIITKVVTKIVKISKTEMEYLVSKGLKFGTNSEGDLHRTFSNKKTYYLTESKNVSVKKRKNVKQR